MAVAHIGLPTVWQGRQHSRQSIEKMRAAHFQGKQRLIRLTGYVYMYAPDHPRAANGRVAEHVLVMEKHIGRYLVDDEVVHHRNEVKFDNALENLQLMTNSEHVRMHAKQRGAGRWPRKKPASGAA